MSPEKLLSSAADTLWNGTAPEIVMELCGDFVFDKMCPSDHARKVAVAAYEAGRQSVIKE